MKSLNFIIRHTRQKYDCKKNIALLGFFLLTLPLFSQINIDGELRLGDTSQVHILITKNGDQLIGRVTGFDGSHLQFLMLGNELTFMISEVENILVQNNEVEVKNEEEEKNKTSIVEIKVSKKPKIKTKTKSLIYCIFTKEGTKHEAELIGLYRGNVILRNHKEMYPLNFDDVFKIKLLDDEWSEKDLSEQYYYLTNIGGKKIKGQITGFQDYYWQFKNMDGQRLSLRKNNLEKIELIVHDKVISWLSENDTSIVQSQNEKEKKEPIMKPEINIPNYRIITKAGFEHEAELIGLVKEKIFFRNHKGLYSLKFENIQRIEPLSDKWSEENFSDYYYFLTKTGGEIVKGQITGFQDYYWQFKNMDGQRLSLRKNNLEKIELIKQGELVTWDDAPQTPLVEARPPSYTRHFIAPTGFLLKEGQMEYQNTEIIASNFDYGITDHVNVGVGVSSILFASTISGKIKVGTNITKWFHLAVGGQAGPIVFIVPDAEEGDSPFSGFSTYHATLTCGTPRNHFTVSLGGLRIDTENSHTITFAGAIRTNPNFGLFAEYNQINNGYLYHNHMVNIGGSIFLDSGKFDFGITFLGNEDVFTPFPIIAYSYYF